MSRALLLALLLPLAACGSDSSETVTPASSGVDPVVEAAPDTLTPEAASGDARPATKAGTVSVEGNAQSVTLRLVREDDFPLPFSTYAPEAMDADWSEGHEGAGAHFTLGEGDLRSTLTVFVPASDPGNLAAWALNTAESMGEPQQLNAFPSWVSAAYSFGGIDVMGSIRAGRHNGRAFYVLETMPPDMGDGFAPNAAIVLDEWRWLDDGSGFAE